jgi:site-specific DNA recombinase
MARHSIKRQNTKQLALDSGCTALYLRVSTDKQADEGFSLDAQHAKLEAYCLAQDWVICPDHIYVDAGISGKTTDRPQFQAMLQAAQAGQIKRIVAIKLDRMARNVKSFLQIVEDLQAWDCALVLIKESFDTSTPHGKFALTMFAAMAELEAATITERVMTGKAQKASTGGYNGSRCPLGYTYANEQFQVSDQAATVQGIFADFIAGKTLSAIAKQLNDCNAPTQAGGAWYPATVRYIITNGFYAGISQWDGQTEAQGTHPSIISPDVYELAQRRLQALRPGKQLQSEIERRLQQPAQYL